LTPSPAVEPWSSNILERRSAEVVTAWPVRSEFEIPLTRRESEDVGSDDLGDAGVRVEDRRSLKRVDRSALCPTKIAAPLYSPSQGLGNPTSEQSIADRSPGPANSTGGRHSHRNYGCYC